MLVSVTRLPDEALSVNPLPAWLSVMSSKVATPAMDVRVVVPPRVVTG